jgi:diguanylate cyclase (GGDEF)-like protein/PAS domain S-box-containing protein
VTRDGSDAADPLAGARLAELADVLGEWIVIADAGLRLRYANPAARRGLALPAVDRLSDVRATDLVAAEDQTRLAQELSDAIADAGRWTGELSLCGLDGRVVDVECTIVGHDGAENEILHYSFLGRDVTSLRSVERALRESEERFRLIADSSPTGIYFIADGGLITYANRRLAEILGETAERVIGRSLLEWVHPDDLASIVESGELLSAQPRESNVELRIRRPSGEVRWLRAQGAPAGRTDQAVHGFVGSIVDISEERAAQRELAKLGRALEASRDLVSFHDPDGRPFYANTAAREFYNLEPDAPLPFANLTDLTDAEPARFEELRHALETKGRWTGELDIIGPGGRRMPASVGVVAHRDEHGAIEYYSALSRDLSDQRSMTAARRRSETMLRAIVQSSPLAIFALDSHGSVQVWNRASEELFGWSADEVVGHKHEFVVDADEELSALVGRVFAGDTVKGHQAQFVRRDGRSVDVDVSLAPLRNTNDEVVAAIAVLADVTEQKQSARALLESEVWFRSLVQNSSDMVMVIGTDGTFDYMSPSATEFVGFRADDVAKRRVNEVLAPAAEDLASLQETFARLRSQPGSVEMVTFRVKRADGAMRWIEMAASNLIDDSAVRGIVINARDITEAFEADAAVRESEERLSVLVSSVSDAITVVGADGTLVYSSPVADEMFGDLGGDAPGTVFDSLDPSDRPAAIALFEQTLTAPGLFHPEEVRIRRSDGSILDAEVIANNLLDEPAVRGIVMTIRDITERKRAERALLESDARLRESEARYRAVVDDQTELVCRYLPDTKLTFVNRAFAEFYGSTPDELVGSLLIDLHPPSARVEELERLQRFGPGAEVQTYDDWELAGGGARRWYRWTDRAFLDEQGDVVEFQSVGHDVTREHRAAMLTANEAEILKQVARGVPLDETLRAIAGAFEDHFPRLSCAIFLHHPETSTLRLGAAPTLARPFVAALDGVMIGRASGSGGAAAASGESVFVSDARSDGRWAQFREVVVDHGIGGAWSTPILATDGRTVLGTLDVFAREPGEPDDEVHSILSMVAHLASIAIEHKAFEDRLAHQSMHDPLTRLPNRVLFLDRLELAIARGRRTRAQIGVLFVDLDRFKNVNDSLGHEAGDELLVAVARRIEAVLRPGDTVARFGGDEFTILCEDLQHGASRERAIEIGQRLRAAVAQPFVVRDAETFVGLSVGIAITERGDETADELLRDADAAMYHAKELGRGRVEVFDDTMRARALARHTTENELHRAIERGELRLFYQPIISLTDACCIGAEALVRWQHPERGLVAPAEFIPLAEDTGLIVPLGAWVLEEAATQAARWQLDHAGDFFVSINLSARQLAQPDLADQMAQVIGQSGARASNLFLEITETAFMEDAEAVMRVIERVRALGVRFAIDDFGTGYSSLGYLKRFAVDSVKIDRAFVNGLAEDSGDLAIVTAVVGLAHALGLRVVAEGVETEAQLTELVSLGCDEAQGYYFAPPQPAADLQPLVSSARRWRPPGSSLMGR